MIQLFHRVTAIVPDAPPAEGQCAIRIKAGRHYPVNLAPESGDPGHNPPILKNGVP
jgi:hypothetical protein